MPVSALDVTLVESKQKGYKIGFLFMLFATQIVEIPVPIAPEIPSRGGGLIFVMHGSITVTVILSDNMFGPNV